MEKILNELKIEISDKNVEMLKKLNEELLQPNPESEIKDLSSCDSSGILFPLLKLEDCHQNIEVFKCIAEVTKNTYQRSKYTNREIIVKIIEMMKENAKQELLQDKDILRLLIQICRALGNILHSSYEATNLVFQFDLGASIISLLDLDLLMDDPDTLLFAAVRGGLLCNYLLGDEEICVKAIEKELIPKITRIIEAPKESELLHIIQVIINHFILIMLVVLS